MAQLKEYIWLIETVRRFGKISFKELACEWEHNKDMSDYEPLHRGTFNRWRKAVREKLGVDIECQKTGGYLYYIANPDDIDADKLKQWMLDTFAVGNIVEGNVSLKNRILVEEVPSGHKYLTTILDAMKRSRVVELTYQSFRTGDTGTWAVEPYCVKLFEGRWHLLAKPVNGAEPVIYGLDRIISLNILETKFNLPDNFSAAEFFETKYGIVADKERPHRIVLRAYRQHKHYLRSLPMHHSQREIGDYGDYADFELYVAPTFDFVMRLLHDGAFLEVMSPASLRRAMKGWITDMYELYEDD